MTASQRSIPALYCLPDLSFHHSFSHFGVSTKLSRAISLKHCLYQTSVGILSMYFPLLRRYVLVKMAGSIYAAFLSSFLMMLLTGLTGGPWLCGVRE